MKKGDKLQFIGDGVDKTVQIFEVRDCLSNIVFIRELLPSGGVSMTDYHEIKDLETWGYKKV